LELTVILDKNIVNQLKCIEISRLKRIAAEIRDLHEIFGELQEFNESGAKLGYRHNI
jgi:hypothetical protein